jgi:hypothetical protein
MLILFLIGAASGAVVQPATTFKGDIGMYGHNVSNASIITAEQITSTDDMNVTDNVYAADVIASASVQAAQVSISGNLLMDAGSTGTLAGIGFRGFSTDDNWSIDSSFAGYNTYLVGNSSADQIIELDGAANTTNKPLMFMVVRNPGAYNVTIEGKGLETIAGNDRLNTTENYATLSLISDGTEYYILASNRTWTT